MYSDHKAPRTVSRRVVLGTAAGAGAVGAAAAIAGVKLTGGDDSTSDTGQVTAAAANSDTAVPEDMAQGPAVFFVEEGNPEVRVYYGANEYVRNDPRLSADLWQKAQQS
jgi:predicted nicotinamide N-methyase